MSSLVLCFFQFGLVCDKAVLLETSQAVFTVGVVIGIVFFQFGLVCDKAVLLETSQAVFTVGVVIGIVFFSVWFGL